MGSLFVGLSCVAVMSGSSLAADSDRAAGPSAWVPLLSQDKAWDTLPAIAEGNQAALPAWALALAESMPRTTAAMLELDTLHRVHSPLGVVLAARLRWTVARANQCAYAQSIALADLRRAGLEERALASLEDSADLPDDERLAVEFAARLTKEADALTDEEVARVAERFGNEQLVAIVLLVAHASFQDRLWLALGIQDESGEPVPPVEVKFATGSLAEAAPPPQRVAPRDGQPPEIATRVDDPEWQALDFEALQAEMDRQRERPGRIPVPTWEQVVATFPEGRRPPQPLRIRWSLVCRGYQPAQAGAWSAATRAFAEESGQDRVFEESLFWVITRTIHCFY